jgi:hypothetical protein
VSESDASFNGSETEVTEQELETSVIDESETESWSSESCDKGQVCIAHGFPGPCMCKSVSR